MNVAKFICRRLVFCYNLPEVSKYFQLVLSPSDIKAIFAGKINSWNDVRIRHKNPGKYSGIFYILLDS